MKSIISTLCHRLLSRTQPARRAGAARLRLEQFEGRDVPATFFVTNGGDNGGIDPTPFAGTGTLRQAIVDAQYTLADNDEIVIPLAVRDIYLEAPLPTLVETHTIRAESTPLTPRAAIQPALANRWEFRFLDVIPNGATTTLENLTVQFFGASQTMFDNGDGGAIRTSGELRVTNCSIYANSADGNGGAIATGQAAALGHLTITNTHFEANSAGGNGGAIYSQASFSLPVLEISYSSFGDNHAVAGSGGAIYFSSAQGILDIFTTSFGENNALLSGGAIFQAGGHLTVAGESGFSSCVAFTGHGGAIAMSDPVSANIWAGFYGNSSQLTGRDVYVLDPGPPADIAVGNRFQDTIPWYAFDVVIDR